MLRKRSAKGGAGRLLPALAVFGAVVLVLDGCGSRGALEGSTDEVDAAPEAAPPEEVAAPEDASTLDAGREGGQIVACGACVLGTCGQSILACFQSEGCRAIFGCVASECLGGGGSAGGLDPGCLIGCAGSDPAAVLQVVNVFQCVTRECGADCGSVLDGLGGGGGGSRDAGGGRRDAGGGVRDAGDAGDDNDAGARQDGGGGDGGGADDAGDEP